MLPTVTSGGSLVVSLIEGKTPEESVQILAEQLDFLIGRVETVETKQATLEIEQAELQVEQISQKEILQKLYNPSPVSTPPPVVEAPMLPSPSPSIPSFLEEELNCQDMLLKDPLHYYIKQKEGLCF